MARILREYTMQRRMESQTAETINVDEQRRQQQEQYTNELQIMLEMGLPDANTNLQALILCNGNVEMAINFVLTNAELN